MSMLNVLILTLAIILEVFKQAANILIWILWVIFSPEIHTLNWQAQRRTEHAISYISRTHLSYNCQFLLFDHFHPFLPPSQSCFWQSPICSWYLWACLFIPHISEIYREIQHLSFSVWLISLSIMPSRSSYDIARWYIWYEGATYDWHLFIYRMDSHLCWSCFTGKNLQHSHTSWKEGWKTNLGRWSSPQSRRKKKKS